MSVNRAILWFCVSIFLGVVAIQGDEDRKAETELSFPKDSDGVDHVHLISAATDPFCGTNSLYVVCELCKIETTLKELKILTRQGERGTTMLGLFQAAKTKGLYAKAVKCEFPVLKHYLKRHGVYAIPHVNDNHFFVIYALSDGYLSVIDVPKQPYEMSGKDFTEIWDGNVLLLSKSPLPNFQMRQYIYLAVLSILTAFLVTMYFLRVRRAKGGNLKEQEPSV